MSFNLSYILKIRFLVPFFGTILPPILKLKWDILCYYQLKPEIVLFKIYKNEPKTDPGCVCSSSLLSVLLKWPSVNEGISKTLRGPTWKRHELLEIFSKTFRFDCSILLAVYCRILFLLVVFIFIHFQFCILILFLRILIWTSNTYFLFLQIFLFLL